MFPEATRTTQLIGLLLLSLPAARRRHQLLHKTEKTLLALHAFMHLNASDLLIGLDTIYEAWAVLDTIYTVAPG